MTGALTGVLATALLAGCGAPDLSGEAASPAPVVTAAASEGTSTPEATSMATSTTQPAPTQEATPAPSAGETGAAGSSDSPNDADLAFARQMVPHHLQALELAGLVTTRARDLSIGEYAAKITAARGADIRTLQGWLDMWGAQPLPRDHEMPGMQKRAELEELAKLNGPSFDRKFLTLMIEHNNGAIKLARTEQDEGAFPGAKALATATATALSAEVKELKKYLARLD
nr:DUF305 domain-containing protein [Microbispora rosea]